MSQQKITKYYCDRCEKELKTWHNTMNISTVLKQGTYWVDLQVHILLHYYGGIKGPKIDKAKLCRDCAIELLTNALKRIKDGERCSKGTESSHRENWDGTQEK